MTEKIQATDLHRLQGLAPRPEQSKQPQSSGADFALEFQRALSQSNLRLSGHAQKRLNSREIQLTAEQIGKVGQAIEKAVQKGARESLMLFPDVALIVSIKNRTVITAVNKESVKENVFTNIDSAVILD